MSIQISYEPYIISCTSGNFGSPFVYIFRNVPNSILTAAIFKFKMVAGYHVHSDGTRLHINLYSAYIKNAQSDVNVILSGCTLERIQMSEASENPF